MAVHHLDVTGNVQLEVLGLGRLRRAGQLEGEQRGVLFEFFLDQLQAIRALEVRNFFSREDFIGRVMEETIGVPECLHDRDRTRVGLAAFAFGSEPQLDQIIPFDQLCAFTMRTINQAYPGLQIFKNSV
jgi:hypothetical protein